MTTLHGLSGTDATATAVEDGDNAITWGQLEDRSTAMANGIEALGGLRGTHVAICVGNRFEFVEAVIGAWRAGCAYTPLKTGWTAEEIGRVLDDAGTRVVITDRDSARSAAQARNLAVIDIDSDYETWLSAQSTEPLSSDRFGFKMAFTSGTTGRPKGVVPAGSGTTDFETGWRGTARWAQLLGLPDTGSHLFLSRLFNGAPQTFGFGAMARGCSLRILKRWDPTAALAALSTPDVTSTIMVPTMFRQLLALPGVDRSVAPNPSLRTILHGGEPCPTPLKAAMAEWFGEILVEYYGFTEGGITTIRADEWRRRPGSVGRPIAALDIHILDDAGQRLPPNTEGTVHFASAAKPNYFVYQGDQDKTDRAFTGNAFTVGDVGYVDDDGYLYLCGRLADVVVSAGVNIYPAEIEQALTDVPGIADLCAVGGPDPDRGEVVVLFIALLPGGEPDAVLAAVATAAEKRIAPYKRPREVVVVPEIPRDQTGKLLRRVLRDPLWEGHTHFAAGPPPT